MTRRLMTEYYEAIADRLEDLIWNYKNLFGNNGIGERKEFVTEMELEYERLRKLIEERERREQWNR